MNIYLPLPRGDGVARQAHHGPQEDPVLDDLLGQTYLKHLRGAAERRHDPHRRGRVRGPEDRADPVPQGPAARSGLARPANQGQDRASAASFEGIKDGKETGLYLQHLRPAEAFKEVQAQAISYTTGVPAMIGAMMMLKGIWQGAGVFNMEQFDPDPFMAALNLTACPGRSSTSKAGCRSSRPWQ